MRNKNGMVRYTAIMLLALTKMGYTDTDISLMSGISAPAIRYMKAGERDSIGVSTISSIENAVVEALEKEGKNGNN